MILRGKRRPYRAQIERDLPKEPTGKQVLDHIFGTYDNDYRTECDFQIFTWEDDGKTKLQRFNMLWAMPLTLILSPFMYVKNGKIGWDDKTRFSRFILRVTGHLKD